MSKKYKLIKEYPNSPPLGYTTSESLGYRQAKYPEFWEEVIEKDYEILSFKYQDRIDIKRENGLFSLSTLPTINKKGSYKEESYPLGNMGWQIHSIKRLADGEIFTVGDHIKGFTSGVSYSLKSINLGQNNSHVLIFTLNPGLTLLLSQIVKHKPLFKTEDDVDIFEGDNYWFVNKKYDFLGAGTIMKGFTKNNPDTFKFSTKEKAEEYILMNKPCLSLNDVFNTVTWLDNSKKLLKDLVEDRIKI